MASQSWIRLNYWTTIVHINTSMWNSGGGEMRRAIERWIIMLAICTNNCSRYLFNACPINGCLKKALSKLIPKSSLSFCHFSAQTRVMFTVCMRSVYKAPQSLDLISNFQLCLFPTSILTFRSCQLLMRLNLVLNIYTKLEKPLMLGKIESRRRRGQGYEIVGWHHRLKGHEFEQTPGDGEGKGSLACWSTWVRKEWTRLNDWTPPPPPPSKLLENPPPSQHSPWHRTPAPVNRLRSKVL